MEPIRFTRYPLLRFWLETDILHISTYLRVLPMWRDQQYKLPILLVFMIMSCVLSRSSGGLPHIISDFYQFGRNPQFFFFLLTLEHILFPQCNIFPVFLTEAVINLCWSNSAALSKTQCILAVYIICLIDNLKIWSQ